MMETVYINQEGNDNGFVLEHLKSSLSVDKAEQLEVALMKMSNSTVPNVDNSDGKLFFVWELREYLDGKPTGVTSLGGYEIPTGYYDSVSALLEYMVYLPQSKHLDADARFMRKEMMLNVSELVKVESTKKMTRIVVDSEKGLQLFSDDRVGAYLKLDVSDELSDLMKRSSGNTDGGEMWLSLTAPDNILFDNHSSRLHEQPFCHLMMDNLQEAMIDGNSKPVLFSFPQNETEHEPWMPRFVLYKVHRMGSRADVKSLRLWLESESGEKIILPEDKRSFKIQLMWKKSTHHG